MPSPSCRMFKAQTSASSSPRLNQMGRTWPGSFALRKKGSSPLSTSGAPFFRPAQISSLALQMFSWLPRLPMWDTPMQVMMPASGRAHCESRSISPKWLMPISTTAYSVSFPMRNRVRGRPSSLFWLPSVLMVLPKPAMAA